jgi:hypothetical protein
MRVTRIFETGKIIAAQVRQAIIYKEQESQKTRSNVFLQILIGLGLTIIGILLGYFFPIKR